MLLLLSSSLLLSYKKLENNIYIKKMVNLLQNQIEQFNKDINLLQYKLKKLKDARKQATKTKNRQKRIVKMNKIDNRKKQIKREINLLQGRVEQFKKRQITGAI